MTIKPITTKGAQGAAFSKNSYQLLIALLLMIPGPFLSAQPLELYLLTTQNQDEFLVYSEEDTGPVNGVYEIEFDLLVWPDSITNEDPDIVVSITSNSWLFPTCGTEITVSSEEISSGATRFTIHAIRDDSTLQTGSGELVKVVVDIGVGIALEDFPAKRQVPSPSIEFNHNQQAFTLFSERTIQSVQLLDLNGDPRSKREDWNPQSQQLNIPPRLPSGWYLLKTTYHSGEIKFVKIFN